MVYIILIIGILLIILNVKYMKEDKNSFSNTLKNEEKRENKDYDVEIISIRKDLAESLLELQKEIEILKEEIYNLKEKEYAFDNKKEDITHTDIISEINFNNTVNNNESLKNEKTLRVKSLLENNKTEEEICNELGIGKGEVLLIRSLLKK